MQLNDIGDLAAVVHWLLVGDVELDSDAEVRADDDNRGEDEVEGEHGDDEREALVFHLPPGEWAGQAEGLRAIAAPAQHREQRPHQSVKPDPDAQQLHIFPANFLLCRLKRNLVIGLYW